MLAVVQLILHSQHTLIHLAHSRVCSRLDHCPSMQKTKRTRHTNVCPSPLESCCTHTQMSECYKSSGTCRQELSGCLPPWEPPSAKLAHAGQQSLPIVSAADCNMDTHTQGWGLCCTCCSRACLQAAPSPNVDLPTLLLQHILQPSLRMGAATQAYAARLPPVAPKSRCSTQLLWLHHAAVSRQHKGAT